MKLRDLRDDMMFF